LIICRFVSWRVLWWSPVNGGYTGWWRGTGILLILCLFCYWFFVVSRLRLCCWSLCAIKSSWPQITLEFVFFHDKWLLWWIGTKFWWGIRWSCLLRRMRRLLSSLIQEIVESLKKVQTHWMHKRIFEWLLDKNTNIWHTVNAFNNYFSDFEAFLIALLKGD
jgi:hypothetical protein